MHCAHELVVGEGIKGQKWLAGQLVSDLAPSFRGHQQPNSAYLIEVVMVNT